MPLPPRDSAAPEAVYQQFRILGDDPEIDALIVVNRAVNSLSKAAQLRVLKHAYSRAKDLEEPSDE